MTRARAGAGVPAAVPAPVIFLGAGVSMYLGAALAVGLFERAGAVSVGWARLVVAALVLAVLVRPWQLAWTWRSLRAAAVFGLMLGAMNLLFYVAIDHLPLGAAVAIEFTGPVAVAVVTARGGWDWRRIVAPLLAASGVAAIGLGEVDWAGAGPVSWVGVAFALAAGAAWAGYMVLGRRIAAGGSEPDPDAGDDDGASAAVPLRRGMASLALGMATAGLAYAVVGAPGAGPLVADVGTIGFVVLVAVLSSVVPYALDQVAMRRLSTATFALLNALLPATATIVGFLSLRQVPSGWELGGVVAISVAVALATRRATPQPSA